MINKTFKNFFTTRVRAPKKSIYKNKKNDSARNDLIKMYRVTNEIEECTTFTKALKGCIK